MGTESPGAIDVVRLARIACQSPLGNVNSRNLRPTDDKLIAVFARLFETLDVKNELNEGLLRFGTKQKGLG